MSAPFFGNTMIIWDSYKNGKKILGTVPIHN